MNTKNLKAYAPKARAQFIEAIKKRAAQFGLYQDKIADVQFEGGAAIIEGRAFTKKQGEQRKRLEQKIAAMPSATHEERYNLFIREMAYTWFNRLAAIRYMELHDYLDHGFRVLSPAPSKTIDVQGSTPEILDNAADVADSLALDKNKIIELQLAGNQEEALYRELLLGQCHHLHKIMPFMFEAIDDSAELFLPNNLTKTDSILKGLVNEIPEEDWQSIEVIGWLYQFYISEHKDTVIGKVVKSEDIPAATQLFTPNWIVKYLVQNSLGRQWLATYPESELKGKMEYYIEPAKQTEEVNVALAAITPSSIDPETIKILDPAAGSGHILVEVYEVLREIYLERGYRLREIPELILTKNIYGLDIDDRAAQLAGFALMMKAREDDRRIFERVERGDVELNVYSLQSTESLDIDKLWQALNLEGKQQQGSTGGLFDDLADEPAAVVPSTSPVIPAKAGIYAEYYQLLQTLKSAFLQAKTLGSLIQIDHKQLPNIIALTALCQEKVQSSDYLARSAANTLMPILSQARLLAQQYDVVVANPPYMGAKYYCPILKDFSNQNYKESKQDLYSMFMHTVINMMKNESSIFSMITIPNWMFLSSFEKFRNQVCDNLTLTSLLHLGRGLFGADFGATAFSYQNFNSQDYLTSYYKLFEKKSLVRSSEQIKKSFFNAEPYLRKKSELSNIPGRPISYWVNESLLETFQKMKPFGDTNTVRAGLTTGNTEKYLRFWHEIDFSEIERSADVIGESKYLLYDKGGEYNKWYGNKELVIRWDNTSRELMKLEKGFRPDGISYFGKPHVTWAKITIGDFSCRFSLGGGFDATATSAFGSQNSLFQLMALLNSKFGTNILNILNSSMVYLPRDIKNSPVLTIDGAEELVKDLINITKEIYDLKELSFEFQKPLFMEKESTTLVSKLLSGIETKATTDLNLFKANINQLESSLDSKVADLLRETCFSSEYIQEKYNLTDELMSYSTGCMMGRYSLDREGLVYAHSGNEGFKELVAEGVYNTFPADDDGIVPLASEEWLFEDDATTRFREFVKTVWGGSSPEKDGSGAHLQENLEFVAQSLCLHALKPLSKKGANESAMDTIRRYFSTKFFKDHQKTYKKRPIYWLFSSGKEKAFECLVYLHRYNEGTLSRMRTEYVTPLMGKYEHMLNHLADKLADASSAEKRNIEKEQKALTKKQAELRSFDEQLKHYAEMRITLDLDDGVKANYGKFGNLLSDVKAIHGKAVK